MCRTRQTRICQNIYMIFCEFCEFWEYFRNVPCLACTLRGSMKPDKLKLFFSISLSPSLFLLHIHRKQAKTFVLLSQLSTNKVSAAMDNVLIQSFKHGRFILCNLANFANFASKNCPNPRKCWNSPDLPTFANQFGKDSPDSPKFTKQFGRTRQTRRHSPNAIFEKNVTCLAKFARVLSESHEFGASGQCLIVSLFSFLGRLLTCLYIYFIISPFYNLLTKRSFCATNHLFLCFIS